MRPKSAISSIDLWKTMLPLFSRESSIIYFIVKFSLSYIDSFIFYRRLNQQVHFFSFNYHSRYFSLLSFLLDRLYSHFSFFYTYQLSLRYDARALRWRILLQPVTLRIFNIVYVIHYAYAVSFIKRYTAPLLVEDVSFKRTVRLASLDH